MVKLEIPLARKKRLHSLYDHAAGRVRLTPRNHAGLTICEKPHEAIAPDEALLNKNLIEEVPFEQHKDLPNSDLMEAIHLYAADYFRRMNNPEGFKAFDETALIAMAIQMEEYIAKTIGKNGHLVYAQDRGRDEVELSSSSEESEYESDLEFEVEGGEVEEENSD